jgi:hypothetical protein
VRAGLGRPPVGVRQDEGMTETPLDVLARWEDHGALWRVQTLTPTEAVVDLCACTGERMEVLRSGDPELLAYLARRPTSEADRDPG